MAAPRNIKPKHDYTVDELIALIPTWEEANFTLAKKKVNHNQLNALVHALADNPSIKHLDISYNGEIQG